jgi:hypothetical protein
VSHTRRPDHRKASPHSRREKTARKVVVSLKLAARDAERVRAAMARPEFMNRLRGLLDDALVEIAAYENLAALCRNRRDRYLGAEETFRLYRRNGCLVDQRRMKLSERALIERLAARYGDRVLNANW